MKAEAIAALALRPGAVVADGTIGGGGHAEAILAATSPTGWLYGCDCDGAAVEAAGRRLEKFSGRFEIRRGNFAGLAEWVPEASCDAVLIELGVSSPQLDEGKRGFSFLRDGPLDMRMDQRRELTAADLVNQKSAQELAGIFWKYGGERDSRKIARAICEAREGGAVTTTRQLAEIIEKASPRYGRKSHPATKVFQALRLVVNDEIGSLEKGLAAALKILKPGGRLAVISFHSLEDRVVKQFGRERARDYSAPGGIDVPELRQPKTPELKLVSRKAIPPDDEEQRKNPRSRSAQLRIMEKVGATAE